jgi:uncharacterized C2H2 Zn-finger protein
VPGKHNEVVPQRCTRHGEELNVPPRCGNAILLHFTGYINERVAFNAACPRSRKVFRIGAEGAQMIFTKLITTAA